MRARASGRVAAVVALLGLAACGGDDGGNELMGQGATTTTAVATTAPAADPSTTAAGGAGGPAAAPTTAFSGPTGGPLEITALDYEFELPSVVPKDATSIRLVNEGLEAHELLVGRMNDGVTLEQVKAATSLKTLVPETMVLDVEVDQTAESAIPVTAGNWFMACYLTTPDGTSHSELGMIGTFQVP